MTSFNFVIVVMTIFCVAVVHSDSFIKIPPECEGKKYCETKPENYPESQFDLIVKQNQAFMRPTRYDNLDEERDPIDDYNCRTKVSVIRPFTITTNDTTKLVLQTSIFTQVIKLTECETEGERCFKRAVGLSYTTSCKPTYGTIKMYVFNPDTKEVEHVSVNFPVCCSCNIQKRIFNHTDEWTPATSSSSTGL